MTEILQIQPQINLEPAPHESVSVEQEPHPGVSDLLGLFESRAFQKRISAEQRPFFDALQQEAWDRQNDPELKDALDVWANCIDTRFFKPRNKPHNSGVIHAIGYGVVPGKENRFHIENLQGFIELSNHLNEIVSNRAQADYWAEVPDSDGNARLFFLKGNELVIAYRDGEDADPKVITMIPADKDPRELFFKTLRKEVFAEKAVKRSNKLNGRPPVFMVGGQNYNSENDLLAPMPQRTSKETVVYQRTTADQ